MTRFRAVLITLALAIAISTALAACDVPIAQGAPPPKDLALSAVADCPVGSLCFSARWTAVSDSYGTADSYRVRVSAPGVSIDTTVAAMSFAFRVACPPGASGSIAADVWSVRRGKPSATSKRATAAYTCPDPAPPAPDSVIVAPDSTVNPNPPAGDTGSADSLPLAELFATPRTESPHFDFIRRTFTDFCYCWDGARGAAARAWAASRYDLVMSGSPPAWVALNPSLTQLRYALMQTSFSEEPDRYGKTDGNSLTGKWQYDARQWFSVHPEYDYESMWLHRADSAGTTPADSAHRLRQMIWNNWRYAINPMDPGARAYTIDRLVRIDREFPESRGLFLDEMDHGALSWILKSREGIGVPASVWQDSVVSLVRAIREAIAPAMLQTNAAEYSDDPLDMRVGEAAGSMHLELMNGAMVPLPGNWDFVDSLLSHGTYVDFVGREMWSDWQSAGRQLKYPGGLYASAAERLRVVQLASYYMVVPSDPQRIGLQAENVRAPYYPDSTSQRIYELDVGHPTGPRQIVLDTRDWFNQRARVYARRFDNAVVLIRPMTYWADTLWTAASAVPVPLPSGGPWSYVTARGDLVSIDSLALKESDAVILVRRP